VIKVASRYLIEAGLFFYNYTKSQSPMAKGRECSLDYCCVFGGGGGVEYSIYSRLFCIRCILKHIFDVKKKKLKNKFG